MSFSAARRNYDRETDRLIDEEFEDTRQKQKPEEPEEPEEEIPCDAAAERAAREYEEKFLREPKESAALFSELDSLFSKKQSNAEPKKYPTIFKMLGATNQNQTQ